MPMVRWFCVFSVTVIVITDFKNLMLFLDDVMMTMKLLYYDEGE